MTLYADLCYTLVTTCNLQLNVAIAIFCKENLTQILACTGWSMEQMDHPVLYLSVRRRVHPDRDVLKSSDAVGGGGLHESPVDGPELVELVVLQPLPELRVVLLLHRRHDLPAVLQLVRLLD